MNRSTIVILIDALGFEIARRHGFRPAPLPFQGRLRTVFGFSQAALTTIFTGLRPDRHGLWLMYSFAAERSPFGWLGLLPPGATMERRWVRRLARWKLERLDRIASYYSLYDIPRNVLRHLDLPARRNLFAPGGVRECRSVFDELERTGGARLIWDYRTPEDESFDALEKAVGEQRASFYLLYTAGLDSALHRYGSGDERIGRRLAWYGERIARIAGLCPKSSVFVFGDHGMCDVTAHHDLISSIDALGLSVPGDYIPFYDSTMARFRVFSERAARSLGGVLEGCRWGRLLDSEELSHLGTSFPDGRFGDLVFLADVGSIILPSYMSRQAVSGMHGYHPDSPCMDGALFTNVEIPSPELFVGDLAGFMVPGFTPDGAGGAP